MVIAGDSNEKDEELERATELAILMTDKWTYRGTSYLKIIHPMQSNVGLMTLDELKSWTMD